MEEVINVRMTEKALFDFILFHTYSKFSAVLVNVLGLAIIFMGVINFCIKDITILNLLFYIIAGIGFVGYTPLLIKMRTKKQVVQLQAYKNEVKYSFTQEGIICTQEESIKTYEWSTISKMVVTPKTIGFYYAPEQAFIIPKECFQDKFSDVMKIVMTYLPRERIQLR